MAPETVVHSEPKVPAGAPALPRRRPLTLGATLAALPALLLACAAPTPQPKATAGAPSNTPSGRSG
ncbi:MAG: hypothetical protein VKO44_08500, partial [Cyanobacteriota bacterium]|nr:hypothetical protein [Cyanobacteriota bacterium]